MKTWSRMLSSVVHNKGFKHGKGRVQEDMNLHIHLFIRGC